MSEIKLNLRDSQSTVIATVHGSVGDRLVAALSAEPETIDELEAALRRFEKSEGIPASSLHRSERCDIDEEPYDAGILVIDLSARIVACDSTYSLPGREGIVEYHNGKHCTGFPLGYRLPEDWIFVRSVEEYPALAERRREERAAVVPLDARAVLYGDPLLNFIIQNVRASDVRYALACRDSRTTQSEMEQNGSTCLDLGYAQSAEKLGHQNLLPQAVVDIHRRWLMTPREDLNGKSPREVLFAKRDLIDFDLNSRVNQWSYFLEEPPSLPRDSHAYRFAGFGTHEWVMYYDLVRFLIWAAVDQIVSVHALEDSVSTSGEQSLSKPGEQFSAQFLASCEQFSAPSTKFSTPGERLLSDKRLSFTPGFSLGSSATKELETVSTVSDERPNDVIAYLEELKLTWLAEPNPDLDGYIPFEVIDNERRRRPEAMTGRSMVVDEDCPCCKMMGDESEAGLIVTFCHFDGCNMEDEFAFSWHATLEQWEQEKREWAELDRKHELQEKERAEKIGAGELLDDSLDIPF